MKHIFIIFCYLKFGKGGHLSAFISNDVNSFGIRYKLRKMKWKMLVFFTCLVLLIPMGDQTVPGNFEFYGNGVSESGMIGSIGCHDSSWAQLIL